MTDLIDREAAIIKIFYAEETKHIKCKDLAKVLEILNAMPAAKLPSVDAVPVVRCGECKHMTPFGRCSEFADYHIRPSSSDFCSCGERKDGDRNG